MPLSWNSIKTGGGRSQVAAVKTAGRTTPKLGTDVGRVAFRFKCYQAPTSLVPAGKPARKRLAKVAG